LGPAPVRIAARIESSFAMSAVTSPSSLMTAAFNAFSLSGRLMVTVAMPS
jgi:hypothetical protein